MENKLNIPYQEGDQLARPELLDGMLDDIGVGQVWASQLKEMKEAIKSYCLNLLKEDYYKMYELEVHARSFYHGYTACLHNVKDHWEKMSPF